MTRFNKPSEIFKAITEDGKILAEVIPAGADLDYWRRIMKNYDPDAKPKAKAKKRPSRKDYGYPNKSKKYNASNVLALRSK